MPNPNKKENIPNTLDVEEKTKIKAILQKFIGSQATLSKLPNHPDVTIHILYWATDTFGGLVFVGKSNMFGHDVEILVKTPVKKGRSLGVTRIVCEEDFGYFTDEDEHNTIQGGVSNVGTVLFQVDPVVFEDVLWVVRFSDSKNISREVVVYYPVSHIIKFQDKYPGAKLNNICITHIPSLKVQRDIIHDYNSKDYIAISKNYERRTIK
jgi:hypothetical protein